MVDSPIFVFFFANYTDWKWIFCRMGWFLLFRLGRWHYSRSFERCQSSHPIGHGQFDHYLQCPIHPRWRFWSRRRLRLDLGVFHARVLHHSNQLPHHDFPNHCLLFAHGNDFAVGHWSRIGHLSRTFHKYRQWILCLLGCCCLVHCLGFQKGIRSWCRYDWHVVGGVTNYYYCSKNKKYIVNNTHFIIHFCDTEKEQKRDVCRFGIRNNICGW